MIQKIKHIPRVPVETLTCFGKVPYKTIIEAMKAKERLEKKVPDVKFNIYSCYKCSEYHIGHSSEKTEAK